MPKANVTVTAHKGEKVESLYKRFKRKIKRENLILEIKKRDFFVKPSEIRRQKKRRKKYSDGTPI